MVTADQIQSILKKASEVENTNELKTYWLSRYKEMLKKNTFIISDKSLELAASTDSIESPATTFGNIHLLNCMNETELDENLLHSTVETAVRLLDSLLDIIPFSEDARVIVAQYRKIGLGITFFSEFQNRAQFSEEVQAIDYIGNVVSKYAYRASESLSEEKGSCGKWNKIKLHIRKKSFEYWYNTTTGDIKSGLEISQEFDEDTIENSGYEIIPRRNSHILLFPNDLEWQIWSDRDSTAPITPIQHKEHSSTGEENITTQKIDSDESEETIAESKEMIDTEEIFTQEVVNTKKSIPVSNGDTAIQLNTEDTQNEQNIVEKLEYTEENFEEQAASQQPTISLDLNQMTDIHPEQEMNHNIEEELPEKTPASADVLMEEISEDTDAYQLGELVYVVDKHDSLYGKVYQIEHIDGSQVTLTGSHEAEGRTFDKKNISPVDLFQILDKINIEEVADKKHTTIYSSALIFNNAGEYIIDTQENFLPSIEWSGNILPEQELISYIATSFNTKTRLSKYIGTSVEFKRSSTNLYLVYELEVKDFPDTTTKSLKDVDIAPHIRSVLNIYTKNQIIAQNQARTQNSVHQNAPVAHTIHQPTNSSSLSPMSKYALKLEQLVKTNSFGDLHVEFKYDSQGPRIIAVNASEISSELKHLLDTVLHLVNFMLEKDVKASEIATVLEKQPDQMRLPLNDLLTVLSSALHEAPASITKITPEMLGELEETVVKKVTDTE